LRLVRLASIDPVLVWPLTLQLLEEGVRLSSLVRKIEGKRVYNNYGYGRQLLAERDNPVDLMDGERQRGCSD